MRILKEELWLEYGFIQENGYLDVCWYNEGRWQDLPHFVWQFIKWTFKKDVYFQWRYNKVHYLRGENNYKPYTHEVKETK